jgi:coproporphyrinogen III oxidase-like Fe-S oxidoreductase
MCRYTAGASPLPTDSSSADMFRAASHQLRASGYDHYEISNYAKPGCVSRHNRVYWENKPYLAFGNAAASHINSRRYSRPKDLQLYGKWVQQFETNANWAVATESETVDSAVTGDDPGAALESIMLGLRLQEGVDLSQLQQQQGKQWVAKVLSGASHALDAGLAVVTADNRLALTDPEGMLVSNDIISSIFCELGETGE